MTPPIRCPRCSSDDVRRLTSQMPAPNGQGVETRETGAMKCNPCGKAWYRR